ncbi:MAG: hypothetical protein WA485_24285 [Candidatus Sulfotelmatobacter sp.]
MKKWLSISVAGVIAGLIVFFALANHEKRMIRQDVEQTRAALQKVRSFHFHYDGPNYLAGEPPMTKDVWVFCPSYRYEVTNQLASPEKAEIHFEGTYYAKTSEKWVKVPGGIKAATVQGCGDLTNVYGLGIPAGFDLMLNGGEIHVDNHPRSIAGQTCYDYIATIPTADVAQRKIIQTLCLRSEDHLPLEVKFRGWGADQDSVYTYDQWNKADQPNFPDGFDPALF